MTTDTEALVRRAYHLAEGAKLDIPTADFWYVRDGKIQEFNCHIGMATMFAAGRTAGLRVRGSEVRARTITPTDTVLRAGKARPGV